MVLSEADIGSVKEQIKKTEQDLGKVSLRVEEVESRLEDGDLEEEDNKYFMRKWHYLRKEKVRLMQKEETLRQKENILLKLLRRHPVAVGKLAQVDSCTCLVLRLTKEVKSAELIVVLWLDEQERGMRI